MSASTTRSAVGLAQSSRRVHGGHKIMAVQTMVQEPARATAKHAASFRFARTRKGQDRGMTRQEFLGLPLAQRRKILHAQALGARAYYTQSAEWREWEAPYLTGAADE